MAKSTTHSQTPFLACCDQPAQAARLGCGAASCRQTSWPCATVWCSRQRDVLLAECQPAWIAASAAAAASPSMLYSMLTMLAGPAWLWFAWFWVSGLLAWGCNTQGTMHWSTVMRCTACFFTVSRYCYMYLQFSIRPAAGERLEALQLKQHSADNKSILQDC